MGKWEYLYVEVTYDDVHRPYSANGKEVQGGQGMTIYDYSNWLGQQGWELVMEYQVFLIFKRPLP